MSWVYALQEVADKFRQRLHHMNQSFLMYQQRRHNNVTLAQLVVTVVGGIHVYTPQTYTTVFHHLIIVEGITCELPMPNSKPLYRLSISCVRDVPIILPHP